MCALSVLCVCVRVCVCVCVRVGVVRVRMYCKARSMSPYPSIVPPSEPGSMTMLSEGVVWELHHGAFVWELLSAKQGSCTIAGLLQEGCVLELLHDGFVWGLLHEGAITR